ncbi:MAG: HD domain-containing phosphohydrolase [Bacillota bacterium]|nr:HD domain-containing phosphohydrolase [Bacillota bacterium]
METAFSGMQDILRKATEENHLFLSILNFLPDPSFAIDTEGKITIWNKAIEDLTGRSAESILGKNDYEHSYCLCGERKPFIVDNLIANLLNIPEKNVEFYSINKCANGDVYCETECSDLNGVRNSYQIKASPLYTKTGELMGAIAILKVSSDDKYKYTKIYQDKIVISLQKMLDEKTEETVTHAFRINDYATQIGKALNLTANELHKLALLSALHDLGKIAIPDSIILKTKKLTPEEWEIMKKHSEIGYNITNSIPGLSHISKMILHHHEWWNGKGYPDGLSGEEIPLLSRIIAVVDAYDVMVTGRSYKKSLTPHEALKELQDYAGTHFEPRLVKIFTAL